MLTWCKVKGLRFEDTRLQIYKSILFLHLKALRGGELRLFLHLQVEKENTLTERAR